MIISIPENLTKQQAKQFQADINEQFASGMQYMIGRAGSLDAKAIGLAPRDLEYLAGREFTREEIDRVYGIPAGFWAKEATRANSEAADGVLIEKTVMPLHRLCAEQLTIQPLAYSYPDEQIEAQFEDIRKVDKDLVVREREQNWQVMTVNEARSELGMKELDDPILGDTLVPLATEQSPGGGFGGSPMIPLEETENDEAVKGFREDVRKWETLALRRFSEGKSLDYDFRSEWIPDSVRMGILGELIVAETEEQIKDAFTFDSTITSGNRFDWALYP
jgi:hypothetical protein